MIKSASRSSITNDRKYRSMLAGTVPSNEYLITSTVLTQNEPSVTFNLSGLAEVYKHLQLVVVARTTTSNTGNDEVFIRFNGDSSNSYARHQLIGQSSTVSSSGISGISYIRPGEIPRNSNPSNAFGVFCVDFLDVFSSNKTKTVKSLAGSSGYTGVSIGLLSGLWNSTFPINQILILPEQNSFLAGSRFSLYGVTA